MDTMVKPFNRRAFVTLIVTLTSILLPVTGGILHISNQHQDTRTEDSFWFHSHVYLGMLFMVFVTWHIIMNRKALVRNIKSKVSSLLISREAAWALLIVVSLFILFASISNHGVR